MARYGYQYQKAVESVERTVIGVNKFQADEKVPFKTFKVNPDTDAKQVSRVKELKLRRDTRAVMASLRVLGETARKGDNVVLPILEAVKTYATIGEICDTFREVVGRVGGQGYLHEPVLLRDCGLRGLS